MERMIPRKEAAKMLGINIQTLDAARLAGKIAYVQYVENGSVFFTDEALQEYVARCTHKVKPVEVRNTYRTQRKKRF